MPRQYQSIQNDERLELIRLIHVNQYTIAKAARITGIPYDNAKAINKVYLQKKRLTRMENSERYISRKPQPKKAHTK